MGTQVTYQDAILAFLNEYSEVKPSNWKGVQNQIIVDRENQNYQLVRVGWHENQHIHYTVFHFDLVNGKVYVQENRTDIPILDELEALGIPRKDVFLAFQEAPEA